MNTITPLRPSRLSRHQRGAIPPWVLLALLVLFFLVPLPRLGHLRESFANAPLILFALAFVAAFMVPAFLLLLRPFKRKRNHDNDNVKK